MLLSAPGLSVVALVLFASLVAPALFPLQLLDPAWQLRLAGTLINTAAFPLLGLALLQIAAELGPHDPLLKNRARLCSQLPVLGPADIAQPLPLLKAQVAAVLDQAALQISCCPSCSAMPSPVWRWLWALPPWPGGRAAISRSCRSCRAVCGAPSRAAPPAFPASRMPITSSSSAEGTGSPEAT